MRTPALAAAPALLLALVAGCGGGEGGKDEVEKKATPSPAATAVAGVAHCTLVDEAERDELAGVPVTHSSLQGLTYADNLPSCSWFDSQYANYTVELFMTGTRGSAWARDVENAVEEFLLAPEDSEEYRDLIESEPERAKLDDDQSCQLWEQVMTAYISAPDDDVVFEAYDSDGDEDETHVARAQTCRDGVFAELVVTADEPISKDRKALVRQQVAVVWERARDQLAEADAAEGA